MDRRNPFHRQVELVVRVLPYVARRDEFALKGGTAINLFLRNLPRLSVDVDLAYLPRSPRQQRPCRRYAGVSTRSRKT